MSFKVDITGMVCPMTFVKVKAALEEVSDGGELEIRLNGGEPIQNIPRSLKDEGHRVVDVQQEQDGAWRLRVVKHGLAAQA